MLIVNVRKLRSPFTVAGAMIYFGFGVVDVVFLFLSIPKFNRVLQLWNRIEVGHGPKYGSDGKMMRHAVAIVVAILVSCLADNILYHVHSQGGYE